METHVMIKFLPTILNQLFRVLTSATQEDVAVNVTRQVSFQTHCIQVTDVVQDYFGVFQIKDYVVTPHQCRICVQKSN